MINLIFARCINRGIGMNGSLPWYFKEELQYFAKLTKGQGNNAVLMGRKTWDSLLLKPLVNRTNIIISRFNNVDLNYINHPKVKVLNSIEKSKEYINKNKFDNVWIIGGKEIYDLFLNSDYVDNIYESVINRDYECDTFMAELPESFKLVKSDYLIQNNMNNMNNTNNISIITNIYSNVNSPTNTRKLINI